MNKNQIDFYFDFISPYSYLAALRLPALAKQCGVEINWLPVNLPRLIKLSGNTPPATIRNKAIYSLHDLKRWAAYLNAPFKMIRPGSFDSRPALRIAGALAAGSRELFIVPVFEALWSGEVDAKQHDWLERIIEVKGLPEPWLAEQNETFEENTHVALKAGAFGVPTFILHRSSGRPEMFFGLDHMDFLERACQQYERD